MAPRIKPAHAWTGAGVALTVSFLTVWEGYEPVAKHERIDPAGVITACFGMTNYDRPLKVGEKFTKEQCQKFLAEDLPRYVNALQICIPSFDKQPPHRQAAFASAAYNLGGSAVCRSSMAKKLNAGDVRGTCDAFLLYDRANGKVIYGLHRRREAERAACLRND